MSIREFWQRMGVARWFLLILFIWSLAPRLADTYVSVLWFQELGYARVYWLELGLRVGLFIGFFAVTFALLWGGFKLLQKVFAPFPLGGTTFYWEGRMLNFFPQTFMRPLEVGVALFWSLVTAAAMSVNWMTFALYFNQPATANPDPIFHQPVGFYLFSWPLLATIASWLSGIFVIIFLMAALYAFVAYVSRMPQARRDDARRTSYLMASLALSVMLVVFAWSSWLSRYSEIWHEHDLFAGISYTQAHVTLPGLAILAITLLACALFSIANALWWRRLRWLLVSLLLPIGFYVGIGLTASYVSNFVVKPNELQKETPYLKYNIAGTRAGFNLADLEERSFPANDGIKSLDYQQNKSTFKNVRLWDWSALQQTLKQVQTLRIYYDIPDVDVDRYTINGEKRQVMISARELDQNLLPANSRNWVNERLIYTHGYGIVMNTANDITAEGRPKFLISDMPVKSTVPGLDVKRPEIYFGQDTTTPVYVKTNQKEFDYPTVDSKGEENVYTTYEGSGGISLGGYFRKTLLSWALGDLTKVPFSSAITSESRVLLHRQIMERASLIAPFLNYDSDPYIVLGADGRLYWIIDAYTSSSYYPFSTHYQMQNKWVNYMRNSVKVVIDAYNGTTQFYVYDTKDPMIAAYRNIFPSLFHDASEMPTNLREHVRYPETLFRTQSQVYSLYHMTDVKVFFGREDAWQIAKVTTDMTGDNINPAQAPEFNPLGGPSSSLTLGQSSLMTTDTKAIDPYYVLLRLPGIEQGQEFVPILPFTPSNRDNMIGWLAGRSDGTHYGELVGYNFPKSKLVDGPAQVQARINQNQYLSQQFTLWNSNGSSVLRGNLLVIPLGTGLLYVEPIFLKSSDAAAIPELRLVILVTQDNIAYASTYQGALAKLMGTTSNTISQPPANSHTSQPTQSPQAAKVVLPPEQIAKAAKALEAYQKLTSQGKYSEAGKELETLRGLLSQMQRGDAQH
ncbi:MAG: UPF0182 family protein [Abditibacteriaceae bacterium]